MSPHDNGPQDDHDATNYVASPPASSNTHGTRYSDAPADPHATAYTPTSGAADHAAAGRLPRRFGNYELLEELGHGGMGVVYKAREFTPERMVALKVIRAGELADAEDVRRFHREADEAARLDHAHIVPVYEVGEHGGLHFFTMKLVEGGSLSHHLERYQSDAKGAARLVATAARAVHYAHQRQLLHRDLKPGNILLDASGQPQIADFGLAKRMGGAGEASQSQGVGTPEYMAPEQARGDAQLTTAADVYALGGVLYVLLTGQPPFRGDSSWTTIKKVLTEEPAPPSKIRPGVPRDLETICLKCLQKEPSRRYGSAEALAEDLERWLRGEPIRARSVGAMERAAKWARRKPAAATAYGLLLAALVLGAGGGAATWLWLRAENALGDAKTAEGNAEAAQTRAEIAKGEAETANRGEQEARHQLTRLAYIDRINLSQREWDAGNLKRARALLDEAGGLLDELTPRLLPEKRPWDWGYLNRRFHPELSVLEGYTSRVSSVAFSPDGGRLAYAGTGGTVRLRDPTSGKQLAVLEGHTGEVECVAFSPDGGRLASGGLDKTVRLWDVASGKQLAVMGGHMDVVTSVAFSPDGGRLASASWDETVRLWDAASGKQLVVLKGHTVPIETGHVYSVAFSPDGGRLASGGWNQIVYLWDAASGKQLAGLEGHTGCVNSVAFSPDGRRLASGSRDETVHLWDAASGKQLAVLEGHKGTVFSVAFSPDGGRLASAASEQTVRLWDAVSGKQLAVLEGHTGDVRSVAFGPDGGRLASGGGDGTVRLWDAVVGMRRAVSEMPIPLQTVAFSPDGARTVWVGVDMVRLWDEASGKQFAKSLADIRTRLHPWSSAQTAAASRP